MFWRSPSVGGAACASLCLRRCPPIDRDALTALYERFGPSVYRRARAVLGDEDEARDAMQEVFTKVLEKHGSFRADAPLLHWIYRITTNLCLNRVRQRRRHPVLSDLAALETLSRGSEAGQVDLLAVRDVLSRVDRTTQGIAVHYYLDEMSMEEVAELVGASRKTVGRRLTQFRKRARALLAERTAMAVPQ